MDLFSAFVAPLEEELGVLSNHNVNQSHSIQDQNAYRIRMNSVHFALDNDDGARTRSLRRGRHYPHRRIAQRQNANVRLHGDAVWSLRGELSAYRRRLRRLITTEVSCAL